MLLPLRWLLYGNTGQTTGGTRRNRKIQRKLRRLAQWSEVEFPFVPIPQPTLEDVIVRVEPIAPLKIKVAPVTVVAEIGLFDYEIAATLIAFMEIEKDVADLRQLAAQIRALDNAMAQFSDWTSIEITRSDAAAAEDSAAVPAARSSPQIFLASSADQAH